MKKKRNKRYRIHTKERVWCSVCQTNSEISTSDVVELICGDCFQKEFRRYELAEESKNKKKVKHPAGWNLKKRYTDSDGKVYSFGKEITGEKNAINTKKSGKKASSV